MRRDDIDYHLVPDHHLAVHERLTQWARWVRVRPTGWQVSPMFRQAKSNSFQWHSPDPKPMTNIPEAIETEGLVSRLPLKEREAVRWCYVRPTDPRAMARRLEVTMDGLMELVNRGRDLVVIELHRS